MLGTSLKRGFVAAAVVLLGWVCAAAAAPPPLTPVVVQDYDRPGGPPPKVWVVNVPNGSATARLSADGPHDGRQCLDLRYRFTAAAGQYLGVVNPVRLLAPVRRVRFWVDGDPATAGLAVYLDDVSGETHKFRTSIPVAAGWREVTVDLDAPHEHWGGDKNGKIDYPILAVTYEVSHAGRGPVDGHLRFDGLTVDAERSEAETLGVTIAVTSPAYGADVRGDTRVDVWAPGLSSVTPSCWQAGPGFGTRATAAAVPLDAAGRGSFTFPADRFPRGPITVRLHGQTGAVTDNCYLQLYNTGGTPWHEGMPKESPPAAAGMKLVFADDFDRPLSISTTDGRATYYDHKPLGGDFSSLPFAGHADRGNPFLRRDTYLRIRADAAANTAGLISSEFPDGHGVKASAPCYFECRFLGPNAIGTWPAFWLMTDYPTARRGGRLPDTFPVDELDVIEAYGGEGLGSPNSFDHYCVTPHAWNQSKAAEATANRAWADLHSPVSMVKAGIPSTWFETPHTYGCKVTEGETVYYCDDVEMGRHPTLAVSRREPLFFMVNLATGGGWPVDLSRYDGRADLYVDYVRVYQGGGPAVPAR